MLFMTIKQDKNNPDLNNLNIQNDVLKSPGGEGFETFTFQTARLSKLGMAATDTVDLMNKFRTPSEQNSFFVRQTDTEIVLREAIGSEQGGISQLHESMTTFLESAGVRGLSGLRTKGATIRPADLDHISQLSDEQKNAIVGMYNQLVEHLENIDYEKKMANSPYLNTERVLNRETYYQATLAINSLSTK
jgi:hypothetical protein